MTEEKMPSLEALKDAIRKKPLVIHACSMCGYECSFYYKRDQLGYDSGCYCTYGRGGWAPRDDNELSFYLNPEHGWAKTLNKFVNETPNPVDTKGE
jgi:hypothetical protein